jgi:hypothetical protein
MSQFKIGDVVYCPQNGDEARTVVETDLMGKEFVMKVQSLPDKPISLFVIQKGWFKK